MTDTPIARSMAEFNERVAKPWADEMARRFGALAQEFNRLRAETRAQPCPLQAAATRWARCRASIRARPVKASWSPARVAGVLRCRLG